jgi:hypothetical protein
VGAALQFGSPGKDNMDTEDNVRTEDKLEEAHNLIRDIRYAWLNVLTCKDKEFRAELNHGLRSTEHIDTLNSLNNATERMTTLLTTQAEAVLA